MYDAILLDFYGTLVNEDDAIISAIVKRIAEASPRAPSAAEVAREWNFSQWCQTAHGERFQTQRTLERNSLHALLLEFDAELDADALSEELFAYWRDPAPFPDADAFLEELRVPVCIASNIDRVDLEAAIRARGWRFDHVVTSEDCRSYKPRPEVFRAALRTLGADPSRVLHVGDSLGSDVRGALAFGVDVLWLNRNRRKAPPALRPTLQVTSLTEAQSLGLFGKEDPA